MSDEDILFLSNEPLPQTKSLLRLDLRGSYNSRAKETIPEDIDYEETELLAGHVFFDPAKVQIFSLPSEAESEPSFSFGPDRKLWDLYLVIIPFTLQEPDEDNFYKHVKFCVKLANKEIEAFDLFPRNIFTPEEGKKGYTISIHNRFQEVDDDQLNIGKQLRFAPLQPRISAFDIGKHGFYWVYEDMKKEGKVEAETKQVLAILCVPRGLPFVDGQAYWQVRLQKTGHLEDGERITRTKSQTFRLSFSTASLFWSRRRVPHVELRSDRDPTFDACLVCALPDEARALKKVLESQFHAQVQISTSSHPRRDYYHAVLKGESETLSLQISWLPKYGPGDTSLLIKDILAKFRPRFVGMTGICAGDKSKVTLGDLIVARQAFHYDGGKIKRDVRGQLFMEPRLEDLSSAPRHVIHSAINFDAWKSLAQKIERPDKDAAFPRALPGTVASGTKVRADDPFARSYFAGISYPIQHAIAIDMEGAAFYYAMAEESIPFLFVKGVSDYADPEKNDVFREYAAMLSALYMLSFLQYFVTGSRM